MEVGPLVGLNLNCSSIRMSTDHSVVLMLIGRESSNSSKTFVTPTFLVLPLQIQRCPIVVGGAGLGGEVPAALRVGGHHICVRGQPWRQRCSRERTQQRAQNRRCVPVRLMWSCALTVAPESLRLGFYILEVDVKILPGRLSGMSRDDNQSCSSSHSNLWGPES